MSYLSVKLKEETENQNETSGKIGRKEWYEVTIELRTQLIFPSRGVSYALWCERVEPHVRKTLQEKFGKNIETRLLSVECRRINVHEIHLLYSIRVNEVDELKRAKCDVCKFETLFNDIYFSECNGKTNNEKWYNTRTTSTLLNKILSTDNLLKFDDKIFETNDKFNIFDFWEDEKFWWNNLICYRNEWMYEIANDAMRNEETKTKCLRKTSRLLNHLARLYLQNLRMENINDVLRTLRKMSTNKIHLLKRIYIEPTNGSLFASYISTIYMHNKQQHGLNTKHAAATARKDDRDTDDEREEEKRETVRLQSENTFDAKIFLEISASCDKREIFELMISFEKTKHDGPNCTCDLCRTMRGFANAWKYYDCTEKWWLRTEFNRKFYAKICLTLEEKVSRDEIRIVFTSYKNEFTDRENFISNFLNYYAFYENNEQPLTIGQCGGKMRQIVSIIYIFAHLNWLLMERAMKNGVPYNSISLNQQSLYKSLDNTLYAVFSENSINRIRKETQQKTLNANSPYVNRGLGAVPNCGINAFSTSITHKLYYR